MNVKRDWGRRHGWCKSTNKQEAQYLTRREQSFERRSWDPEDWGRRSCRKHRWLLRQYEGRERDRRTYRKWERAQTKEEGHNRITGKKKRSRTWFQQSVFMCVCESSCVLWKIIYNQHSFFQQEKIDFWSTFCMLPFRRLGLVRLFSFLKSLIRVFSKDTLNWLQVSVKTVYFK